jgi:uncharacterized protein YcfJ
MKSRLAAALAVFSLPALAAPDFVDTAPVISSTPVIERVSEPRQECGTDPAYPQRPQQRSYVGPVLGGIVGGLLGSQVGGGKGRVAAAAAGAVVGTMVGDRVSNPAEGTYAGTAPAQPCRTVESYREVVTGYDVVYRYNGRDTAVRLPYNPGSAVRVGVSVLDAGSALGSAPRAPDSAAVMAYPYRY